MKKFTSHNLSFLALLLASIFWGIVPVVAKLTLRTIPPFSLQLLRFTLASILILPFFLKAKKNLKGNLLKLTLFSLLPFLNVTLFILGIRLTTATTSTVLYASTPPLIAFFSCLLFKEKISLVKIIGVLLGFIGVLTIILLPIIGGEGNKIGDIKGNAILLLGVFCFAFYTIFSKFILKKHSPIVTTTLFFFITTLLSLPLSGFELINNANWVREVSLQALLGVFYLGVFATVGSYFLYQWGVQHSSPIEASITFYVQPIVGSLAAVLVLQEKLTILFLVGAAITLSGVFLTTTLSYLKNSKM